MDQKGLITSKKGGIEIAFRPKGIIEAITNLDTHQQDILDELFSMVGDEGDEDDNLTYEIRVYDLIKQYNIKDPSKKYRQLKKAVKDFQGEGVSLKDPATGEFTWYPWFTKINYVEGVKGKTVSHIWIDVHKDIKHIIMTELSGMFYRKYDSKSIRSKHARNLFYILAFRATVIGTTFEISTDELRERLSLSAAYRPSHIKDRILDPAMEEINSQTEINFSYREVSGMTASGQTAIVAYEFTVKRIRRKNTTVVDEQGQPSPSNSTVARSLIQFEKKLGLSHKEFITIYAKAKDAGFISEEGGDEELYKLFDYCLERKPDNLYAYILAVIKNGFVKPVTTTTVTRQLSLLDTYDAETINALEEKLISN